MTADQRNAKKSHFMQHLINARMNAFGFELLAESVLKHDSPQPVSFVFPIGRSDCPDWAGVAISVTPIPVATEE